uniref:Reverse transcriptase domain-containing protein n=1 Tax=Haemonchus contortus TaxID=6289 RepID=A0A7I4YFG4_HAECO
MLNDLHAAGIKAGLNINMKKTKCMRNEYSDRNTVNLQGEPLEDVDEYVYLGRLPNMKNDLKSELMRGKKAGWAAYNSIRNVIEHTRDDELYQSTGQHWLKIENRGKEVGTRARAIAADNGSPSIPSMLNVYIYVCIYVKR